MQRPAQRGAEAGVRVVDRVEHACRREIATIRSFRRAEPQEERALVADRERRTGTHVLRVRPVEAAQALQSHRHVGTERVAAVPVDHIRFCWPVLRGQQPHQIV